MKLDWVPRIPAHPKPGVLPGMYHFSRMTGDTVTRFHLRVDPDGGGVLLANAAEAAYLSPVGVLMAHGVLSGLDDRTIEAQVRARYGGATAAEIADDLWRISHLITDLASPDSGFPVTNLLAEEGVAGRRLSAPYQAEVVQAEVAEIEPILRALWDIGIPQVTFVLRPELAPRGLVMLVERAGDLGMIAGVRTVAGWLSEETLRGVALAGLDYLSVVLADCDPARHDALLGQGDQRAALELFDRCAELELCPVAQVPLMDETALELEAVVRCATDHGVGDFCFYAIACPDGDERADAAGAIPARALPQVATRVTEVAEQTNTRFIWAPPVRFRSGVTLAQHVAEGPRTSGDLAVRVEPDGSVFPARGGRQCAGNILQQAWKDVWRHDCFRPLRESVPIKRCANCPDLTLCAVGCVRDPALWSDDSREGES